jgi:H+/Cl- antiporter ClcA
VRVNPSLMKPSLRDITPTDFTQYFRLGIRTYRAKLLVQASFWIAAVVVGIFAVTFGRIAGNIQEHYRIFFTGHPIWISLFTPVAFVGAAAVAKFFAPHAGGSGIPQALHAASIVKKSPGEIAISGIVSIKTAVFKVLSTLIGFFGGASIGGEGPTVQVSAAIFNASGSTLKKYFPGMNLQSYLVAGAGAGIAAAFNTPLGGIAFALEEVALSDFGDLKHLVMLAVIIAGLVTQALLGGDTLYLGNPMLGYSESRYLLWSAIIGIIGGILGASFGKLVTSERIYRLKIDWWKRALVCGAIVAGINFIFEGTTSGNGYAMTRDLMITTTADRPLFFPIAKLLATAFSTLSGLGGGILAPSLSIGAWMGASTSKLFFLASPKVCGLLGMVAYLTGAFQIPLTAVVIVLEMTNQHGLILPMMVSAIFSFGIARAIMPVSLYHRIIERTFTKDSSVETP